MLLITLLTFTVFCRSCAPGSSVYYREAVAITPGMAAVVAIAIMITIGRKTVGALKYDEKQSKTQLEL